MKIQHLGLVDEIILCLLLFEAKIYVHIMKGLKIHKMGYNLFSLRYRDLALCPEMTS